MNITSRKMVRIKKGDKPLKQPDDVAVEIFLTLYLNNNNHATVSASPNDVFELTAGILFGDGLIEKKEDILNFKFDHLDNIAYVTTNIIDNNGKNTKNVVSNNTDESERVILSGCGRATSVNYLKKVSSIQPSYSEITLSAETIKKSISIFSGSSDLYSKTGGVHSAALFEYDEKLLFFEDISRHNAVDKLLGGALLKDISLKGKWIATSGRISSDLVFKLASAGITLVASRNAPTSMALDLADILNMTVVGFVRGQRLNVYTGSNRIL